MPCPSTARRLAVAVLALLVAACGDAGTVEWRDLTVEVPEGWAVFEEEPTRLSMATTPLGEDAADPEEWPDDVVAMFFTHEPGVVPGDWREYVDGRDDATVESDVAIEIDGVPATRLIYRDVSNGVRVREMAVVVPAREIAVLVQPIPRPGEEDIEERFVRHLDTFTEVLESIEWGAPVDH